MAISVSEKSERFPYMIIVPLFLASFDLFAEDEFSQQPMKLEIELETTYSGYKHIQQKNDVLKSRKNSLSEVFVDRTLSQKSPSHLGVFDDIWSNTKSSFSGDNFWYHAAAFGSTYALAFSGVDRDVQDYFQEDPVGRDYGTAALVIGAVWQPIIGGVLYFSDNAETKTAGSAILQTTAIHVAYVTLLKGLTGRPDPVENGDPANKQDGVCGNSSDAEAFFQIVRGCTWPSGHAASAFSLVSTLYAFYPEKKWIAYAGYPAALIIGMGMVESDEHWFSDIVAGALIGHVIGWTVGKNFRRNFDRANGSQSSRVLQKHFFSPIVSSKNFGIAYQFQF